MKPLITLAVQCHSFQKRFAWELSSLAEQTMPYLVKVDVAYIQNEGNPNTDEVINLFPQLDIRRSVWIELGQFQFRGLVRNKQLHECDTEWLLFGDCDMVYHHEYFERLSEELEAHKDATYMLSSGRTSNQKEDANALVNSFPVGVIEKPWDKADKLSKRSMSNIGAGHCQLINARHAPHEGFYVLPERNRDWAWTRGGWNTKSDMQFRKRIAKVGGPRRSLPRWFSDSVIHLNHNRDPDIKGHVQEQR
jgi:hypothetical protein